MVPADFQALSRRRAARARVLADRYSASREGLSFFARIADLQAALPSTPLAGLEPLRAVVRAWAPPVLSEAAASFGEEECRQALDACLADPASAAELTPARFFARVLLQPALARYWLGQPSDANGAADSVPARCPYCGGAPQAAVLRSHGHGAALHLACALCLGEWRFPRGRCAHCGEQWREKLAYWETPELPHIRLHACETCRRYLHAVNLEIDPEAVPDADELAALPLDVWASEQGFCKIQPNLLGI